MRKTLAACTAVLAFWGVVIAGGTHDTVWVANRDANTLTVFDARTGHILAVAPTGMGAHDLVVSKVAGKAYVVNETDNTISVLSASTLEPLGLIALGPRPHHIDLSHDGRTAYVGLFNTNRIGVIDTETGDVRQFASSLSAAARAHAPHPAKHGDVIFVPHEAGSNEVSVLDGVTGDFLFSVVAGSAPSEVIRSRNQSLLYVSMRNEGKVKIIDLDTRTVRGEVTVGTQPESLLLTPDEKTLIVSMRGSPAQIAFVNVDEPAAPSLIDTLQIAGEGSAGDLAVMSPDNLRVYVTFDNGASGTGGVAVVDVHGRQLVDTWTYPNTGRPHGIAYSTTKLRLP